MIDLKEYRQQLLDDLSAAVEVMRGLSPEQLSFASEGQWSLIQIAEHIVLTEEMVVGMLSKRSPHLAEEMELLGSDKLNQILVTLRKRKVKAPALLEPQGSIRTAEEFESVLEKSRQQLLARLDSGECMVSTEVYKHPMLGEMTVSDWLYFILHHSARHQLQMKDRRNEINGFTVNP
jgi:hypothetical protein